MSSSSNSVFDVEIKDQETAVSVLRFFLDAAAKRGAYTIAEGARIMEALKYFEDAQQESSATKT